MSFNLETISLILLTLWMAFLVVYSFYRDYRQSTTAEKLAMVRRLVIVAEQTFTEPGTGNQRFTYVINKLAHLYPKDEYADLAELIEAAVYDLNQKQSQ